jgi:hypothetical protein
MRTDISFDSGACQEWTWPVSYSKRKEYTLELRHSNEARTQFRSALHKVVHTAHQAVQLRGNLKVDRVVTCGSVGKHTASAHGGGSDIDIVVYIKGLHHFQNDIGIKITSVLESIQMAMDAKYPGTRDEHFYDKYVKRYVINKMEIDIMVGAASDMDPVDFLSVSDPANRRYLSGSVSHLSKKFIAKQNVMFQDMVRVVKHWRDSAHGPWPQYCKPKSCLLEIILLQAFQEHGLCKQKSGRTYMTPVIPYWFETRVLIKFFELVASVILNPSEAYHEFHLPSLFICFEPYYKKEDLPLHNAEPLFSQSNWHALVRQATAIVMDPTNPTNNLWLTLADEGTAFVTRAKSTLQELQQRHDS